MSTDKERKKSFASCEVIEERCEADMPTGCETDASDSGNRKMQTQRGEQAAIYPLVYYSERLTQVNF